MTTTIQYLRAARKQLVSAYVGASEDGDRAVMECNLCHATAPTIDEIEHRPKRSHRNRNPSATGGLCPIGGLDLALDEDLEEDGGLDAHRTDVVVSVGRSLIPKTWDSFDARERWGRESLVWNMVSSFIGVATAQEHGFDRVDGRLPDDPNVAEIERLGGQLTRSEATVVELSDRVADLDKALRLALDDLDAKGKAAGRVLESVRRCASQLDSQGYVAVNTSALKALADATGDPKQRAVMWMIDPTGDVWHRLDPEAERPSTALCGVPNCGPRPGSILTSGLRSHAALMAEGTTVDDLCPECREVSP